MRDTTALADTLKREHGFGVTNAACLYYLSRANLVTLAERHSQDVQPMLDILSQAALHWADANGFSKRQCCDALADVERSIATAKYIASYTGEPTSGRDAD